MLFSYILYKHHYFIKFSPSALNIGATYTKTLLKGLNEIIKCSHITVGKTLINCICSLLSCSIWFSISLVFSEYIEIPRNLWWKESSVITVQHIYCRNSRCDMFIIITFALFDGTVFHFGFLLLIIIIIHYYD